MVDKPVIQYIIEEAVASGIEEKPLRLPVSYRRPSKSTATMRET